MFKKITRIFALSIFLLMYVTLEVSLFKELGWQSGLVGSLFFTIFALASLAGFMSRPPVIDIDLEADEEANCRP